MTDKEIMIRMYTLQLQQTALLVTLSEKLNLMMEKSGMSKADIEEIKTAEKAMVDAGTQQGLKDWEKELQHIAKS